MARLDRCLLNRYVGAAPSLDEPLPSFQCAATPAIGKPASAAAGDWPKATALAVPPGGDCSDPEGASLVVVAQPQ